MNIINEDSSGLEFYSAKEFIPDTPKEIEPYNFYEFKVTKYFYFKLNITDSKLKEFILEIESRYKQKTLNVYIEGPEINSQNTIILENINNIYFNLTKPGIIYIKFFYEDQWDKDLDG